MSEQEELIRALAKQMQQNSNDDAEFKITLTQGQLNKIVHNNVVKIQNERHMAEHNQKLSLFGIGLIGMIVYLFLL